MLTTSTTVAELRSAGQPGAAVPTWIVIARARTLAPTSKLALLLSVLLALAGCRQDMHDQPRFKPLARAISTPTCARRALRSKARWPAASCTKTPISTPERWATIPEITCPSRSPRKLLARGQQRYDIYCAPCHSRVGDGNGVIPSRGFPRKPPSYHIERLRKAPLGYFFDVITNGFGAMPDYSSQIAPRDRWAIVAYIRALQLSQDATAADVPAGQKVPSEPPRFRGTGIGRDAARGRNQDRASPEEPK